MARNFEFSVVVSSALFCSACGPASNSQEKAQVEIVIDDRALSAQGYETQSLSSFMSANYCYAVHVHTPDEPTSSMMLNREAKSFDKPQAACRYQPSGPGVISNSFAAAGGELGLEVPVGSARRFDLIAVPKSVLGGSCGKTLGFQRDPTDKNGADILVDGKVLDLDKDLKILAHSALVNIQPGENTVALDQVVASSAAGLPYLCESSGSTSSPPVPQVLIPGESSNGQIQTGMEEQVFIVACPAGASRMRMNIESMAQVYNHNMQIITPVGADAYESPCLLRNDIAGRLVATFGKLKHTGDFAGKSLRLQALSDTNSFIGAEKTYNLQRLQQYSVVKNEIEYQGSSLKFVAFQRQESGMRYSRLWYNFVNGAGITELHGLNLNKVSVSANLAVTNEQDGAGLAWPLGNRLYRILSNNTAALSNEFASITNALTWDEPDSSHNLQNDGASMILRAKSSLISFDSQSGYCYVKRIASGAAVVTEEFVDDSNCPFDPYDFPPLAAVDVGSGNAQRVFYKNDTKLEARKPGTIWSEAFSHDLGSILNSPLLTFVKGTEAGYKGYLLWSSSGKRFMTFDVGANAEASNFSCGSDGADCTASPAFYPALITGTTKVLKAINLEDITGYPESDLYLSEFNRNELVLGGKDYDVGTSQIKAVLYRSPDGGKNWYRVYQSAEAGTEIVDVLPVVLDYGTLPNGAPYRRVGIALIETYGSSPTKFRVLIQNYTGY